MSPPEKTYTVGYALAPTKVDSFIQPSLLSHAKSRGIDFISIDVNKPLTDQGPFHCVVHKLYDDEWKRNLAEYSAANPSVPVINDHDSIERLHNRVTMLECVNNIQIGPHSETFAVPKQIVVDGDLDPDLALNFPVIAKPVVANGTAKSHAMSLVFNRNGLSRLQAPVVLQEFVNHGGVVFKVYVAGELVRCVKRKSLPDVSEPWGGDDSMSFSQISNLNGQEESHDYDKNILEAEMPPLSFVNDVAQGLRKALKLHLFNFDMIRDGSDQRRYFVIDINYFPGYAKMPKYETMLTDFFLGIVRDREM